MIVDDFPDDKELIEKIRKRVTEAEDRMLRHFNEALFSGSMEPLTDEERRALKRQRRIKKLLAPYYWLRSRLSMTWSVWRYGSCLECERSEDY